MTRKRYLTYIKQIKQTLKTVLTKKQLLEIKDRIENGLKDYANKQHKIKIEANLPRKNHVQTDANFRGSLFRGASKNRKKWQVMKMINKQTVRIGTISTEKDAARIFDFLAILTEGLSVSIY